MCKSRIVCLSLVIVLLVSLLPLVVPAQPGAAQAPASLEPELVSKLEAEGSANYFVKMEAEADLSPAESMDWDARGEFVWRTLNEVAATTQAPVLAYCQANGLDCTSMLVTNSVFVRAGTMTTAQALAALPGVAYLRLERVHPLPDPVADDADASGLPGQAAAPEATTDWGIIDTKADQVWALGYKGTGIKVANIDSGVQWNHPALQGQFACPGQPTNAACWSDPSNTCGAGGACDNNGHGTHTMGTMVADDNPALTYIAGMAPNATWIACKGCRTDTCYDSDLNACADWILAPGGNPSNRPHIVNNSWGGGGGDPWYLSHVQAWRADGIFPAFSAGNDGPLCSTLGSPGDYQESMASAAHDSGRSIASFSSRGPSVYGHDPYTKPNISAPGVNICSTVPTNSWDCTYDGTSMASPHTAGAVALIWEACPALRGNIDATFQILQDNADAAPAGLCGAPPDAQGNYTYGYGYLNVLNAVQVCAGPTVASITPNHGERGSSVSITNLAGTNFEAGAQVKLTKSGKPDINASGENVVSPTQITCQLNLTGAAIGSWNVVVTNPDAQSGTLANGFTVTGGTPTYLPVVSKKWPPIPDPPTLSSISNPDGDGNYTVSWSAPEGATGYTLQEDDNAAFSSPATAYSGAATSKAFTGKGPGIYYYRVNASNAYGASDWSNTRSVPVNGWITIKSENFEGTFPGEWEVLDAEPSDGLYYWGRRTCRPYEGSYSGWAVGAGDGPELWCGSNYPAYVTAWMVYGPFSLVGASAADLTFQLWRNAEAGYDYVFYGASVNGSEFMGPPPISQNTAGWEFKELDLTAVPGLGNLTGQSNVWIALLFFSDYLVTTPEGVYVDNIVLRKYIGAAAASPEGLPPLPATAREEAATFTLPR